METAYIIAGRRSPFGRYGGALSGVRPDDLAAQVIQALVTDFPTIDWGRTDDVLLGCANQAGEDNRNVARMAVLLAGLPVTTPGITINRLCASGLDSVALAARSIRAGDADLVLAGGVESMTRAPFVFAKSETAWSRDAAVYDTTIGWRFTNPALADMYGSDSMPQTGQHVADEFGVTREDQDAFALRSQTRAAAAVASGRLAREIVPVTVTTPRGQISTVDADEHPRQTSAEKLASLRPLSPGGSVTAGNASGINDGACVLILASGRAVEEYGLTPLARVVSGVSVGVEPRIMGMGPDPAVRRLLERRSLSVSDIDLFELNEAFASQSLAVLRALGLPDDAEYVNPNGGAIALGHPLGASGARLALTGAIELAERQAGRAVITMCVGVGQGSAVLLEQP